MCKYCEDKKSIIWGFYTKIFLEGNKLKLICDDDYYNSEENINYCPMCGRELNPIGGK